MTVFVSYGLMWHHKYNKLTNNVFSTSYDITQLLRNCVTPVIYSVPALLLCHWFLLGQYTAHMLFLALYGYLYGELLFVPF